ncbi:efflux RND transporter permease subunit, partial [Chlamydiales bacterium]|nr:efflux RND transporter permease subunit [Chlamydiales bacterium]
MRRFAEYFIFNRAVTYFITVILFFGGIISFFTLGQLEDPVFTVKTAVVITEYPGASPEEVEKEVTDRIEIAIQEMPQLKNLYSQSKAGESVIKVDIQDKYWSDELPQVWDELRKKIRDVTPSLPPGVKEPVVNDDYGFVYGFMLALTGDGYSPRELEFYADAVKKELSLVKGVTRVDLWGVQKQVVYVELSEQKINELGVSGNTIIKTLKAQNMVVDSGGMEVSNQRYRIAPTGDFKTPEEIGELKIRPSTSDRISLYFEDPLKVKTTTEDFIQLKDIATITRGYQEPPMTMMRYNGESGIVIQIAGSEQENIVTVGKRLEERVEQIKNLLPAGVGLNPIAWQSDLVDDSVNSFIINLIEAVIIVLVVLMIPSGFRMGLIIGFDLVLTILGTFMYMSIQGIPLQRMSLGALIIALGMMVDNAIVISDSIAVKLRSGMNQVEAAVSSVVSTSYPLFAATLVAILAFYPIVASKAAAGEYAMSLFTVVAVALLLSWLIAMALTPLQCIDILKIEIGGEERDEFDRPLFRLFRKALKNLIKAKYLTIGVMAGILAFSLFSFGFVDNMFFPDSSRPQLMIDFWAPEGTRIQNVDLDVKEIESYLLKDPLVDSISSFVGAGPPRFYLPIDPEGINPNYGEIIVNVTDFREIDSFIEKYKGLLEDKFPGAMVRFRKFGVGPSDTWKFEARISGPAGADLSELRGIGEEILAISEQSPYGTNWRLDMMNPVLKVVPDYDQKRARLASVTRDDLAQTLKRGFDGLPVGLYRENDKLLPIVVRNIEKEREEFPDRMEILQMQPEGMNKGIPVSQAISEIEMEWENPIIVRWNRRRAV